MGIYPRRSRDAVRVTLCLIASCLLTLVLGTRSVNARSPSEASKLLEQFCHDCHSGAQSPAGVDFEALTKDTSYSDRFVIWRKTAEQLASGAMPPPDAEQPTKNQRDELIAAIRSGLTAEAIRHEGDPGPVVMRRLTGAEYGYTIRDLTGLELDWSRGFVSDAVGGAGFTNTGIAQFTQESTLEKYLEAARRVEDHAVIGTGPLTFYSSPGQTGLELSAISRIQKIYREHGFRTASGEGGEAFGLDLYPRAFFVAWQFRHREKLSRARWTIDQFAQAEGIDVRFAKHIDSVLSQSSPSFPLAEIVERWRQLPPPQNTDDSQKMIKASASARAACRELGQLVRQWQRRFGANVDSKEEAPVLREDLFIVRKTQPFEMNVNWPKGTKTAHVVFTIESAIRGRQPDAVVIWRKPEIQFRIEDQQLEDPRPLRTRLTSESVGKLRFGRHPRGGKADQNDFVTVFGETTTIALPVPAGARSARLFLTAELDTKLGADCIVRCSIAQLEETDQGKSVSGLLANPNSEAFLNWKSGVLDFARQLPQVSQREPAPSDRDPIPAPIDNSYNNPERNLYHTRVKYHRDDQYLVEKMLDDRSRRELDEAWADLLGSFDYHDAWLQLLAGRYQFDLADRKIRDVDETYVKQLPREAQKYVIRLRREFSEIQREFRAAENRHLDDVVRFAKRAWRRPLSSAEESSLRTFYTSLRTQAKKSHPAAIRALIARTLLAPAFLYRVEPKVDQGADRQLTEWELASRLSYLLWSSVPDDDLRRAARDGELRQPAELRRQVGRMLRDPRARRFATEFFGQWLGFYRFEEHRGVDPHRFPAFDGAVRRGMYREAIELFDHIVREDRPLDEIVFADYTFLTPPLAKHYGLPVEFPAGQTIVRVDSARAHHRGGLFRLGALLTATSAPLRTSPVKRGDWVLRRVLGSPVPPPPADAGSIAGDDVTASGLSIRERLAAHRRDPSCTNCHARIDPFGFALEHFDAVGRWRNTYRDGAKIVTVGKLREGRRIEGIAGLESYIRDEIDRFYRTLSVKLLGYALGRTEKIGDQRLIEAMVSDLEEGKGLRAVLNRVVLSRQFRYHGTRASLSRSEPRNDGQQPRGQQPRDNSRRDNKRHDNKRGGQGPPHDELGRGIGAKN